MTDKTIPLPEPVEAAFDYLTNLDAKGAHRRASHIAVIRNHFRTYAAQVARQMVPGEADAYNDYQDGSLNRAFNACRAATLSAIDAWEKGE